MNQFNGTLGKLLVCTTETSVSWLSPSPGNQLPSPPLSLQFSLEGMESIEHQAPLQGPSPQPQSFTTWIQHNNPFSPANIPFLAAATHPSQPPVIPFEGATIHPDEEQRLLNIIHNLPNHFVQPVGAVPMDRLWPRPAPGGHSMYVSDQTSKDVWEMQFTLKFTAQDGFIKDQGVVVKLYQDEWADTHAPAFHSAEAVRHAMRRAVRQRKEWVCLSKDLSEGPRH